MYKTEFTEFICEFQAEIVAMIADMDPTAEYRRDEWERERNGYGISCCFQNGENFEKAGINVSVVNGIISEALLRQMQSEKREFKVNVGSAFRACGISLVVHPVNPHAPTTHFNYRYFEVDNVWWFGGGFDLSPAYVYKDDAEFFHNALKEACGEAYYLKFSEWCDQYFWIPHRDEHRGIGGIFFDDLNVDVEFIKKIASTYIPVFRELMSRRIKQPYTDLNREWQQIRRGRYVEFNLICDRGTKFGLVSKVGRIESILVSLPRTARWEYCHKVIGEEETRSMTIFKRPRGTSYTLAQ